MLLVSFAEEYFLVCIRRRESTSMRCRSGTFSAVHEAVVKLLLNTCRVDVDLRDHIYRTPLSRAAERGHEAIVKLLLDTGQVDVDSKDKNSWTPLCQAAQYGHEGIVKLLLNSVDDGHEDVPFDFNEAEHNVGCSVCTVITSRTVHYLGDTPAMLGSLRCRYADITVRFTFSVAKGTRKLRFFS